MSNLYEKETLLFSFCYDQGYQHNNNYNCQKYYTQHFAGCLLMFLTLKRKESEKDLSWFCAVISQKNISRNIMK